MVRQVIDAHVHLSECRDDVLVHYAKMNRLEFTLNELLLTMRRLGIRKGLLLTSRTVNGSLIPNGEVLRLCGKSRGLLSPVVTVEPSLREVRSSIKLAAENRILVKAFKVMLGYAKSPADSRVYHPLYDYAESEGLPVLFHTGDTAISRGRLANSHPLSLDGLANRREELKIVLCHFGNPWIMDAAEMVYKHPNVYADTSGLITGGGEYPAKYAEWLAEKLSEAIYYIGNAEKVFFGTDYPVSKHSDALALMKMLEISQRDKENILWRNAERLFKL